MHVSALGDWQIRRLADYDLHFQSHNLPIFQSTNSASEEGPGVPRVRGFDFPLPCQEFSNARQRVVEHARIRADRARGRELGKPLARYALDRVAFAVQHRRVIDVLETKDALELMHAVDEVVYLAAGYTGSPP